MNPLVCICIPNFNSKETILRTLESIKNQSYQNFIVKIFDNCSTDGCENIIYKFIKDDNRFVLYKNKNPISGEMNFTQCVSKAEGKYFCIFHSDDVYSENILNKQVNFLESNNAIAVSTGAYIVDENNNILREKFLPSEILDNSAINFSTLVKLTFKYGNIVNFPSVMMETQVVQTNVVAWNEKDFGTSADLDFWFRVSKLGSFGFLKDPLILYRLSPSSYSFRRRLTFNKRSDIFKVLDEYKKELFISKKDIEYYSLQLLKDDLFISLNNIYIKSNNKNVKIRFLKNIKFAFKGWMHGKIIFLSLALPVIKFLPYVLQKIVIERIYKI
jgi:glycosyltransferase involved in cell wall biosynthesis|tara:strand:+ start:2391 stop:3377 length:987 start_codon:yes stop_codon:yes gene_type:complete